MTDLAGADIFALEELCPGLFGVENWQLPDLAFFFFFWSAATGRNLHQVRDRD